ncbi:DUF6461 domain-containing protein [Streptomyces sp. NPDC085927]|uniref:DUF6461 domain-containing protein n=1 Tax=Streptomyces sp. NPDC085927 TaxID=3365738 RepID=UPI0037CF86A4
MKSESSNRSWLRDFHGGYLLEGYTLTLVRGLSPQEFLDRIDADPTGEVTGFEAFVTRDLEFQDSQTDWGDFMFVGATRVRGKDTDWVLALEINGGIEIRANGMQNATRRTRGVSHFCSPHAMTLFS